MTLRQYRFKRGDDYHCDAIVDVEKKHIITYINFKYPEDIKQDVFDQFIKDAETAVLKQLNTVEVVDDAVGS